MSENSNADREHFERWYCGALVTQGAREIERNAQGDYILMQTRLAWQAWHAGWLERGNQPHTVYQPCEMHKHLPVTLTAIAITAVPVCPHCASGVPGMEKSRADMIALLRDPRFTMSGGSEFALQILAALGVKVAPMPDCDVCGRPVHNDEPRHAVCAAGVMVGREGQQ